MSSRSIWALWGVSLATNAITGLLGGSLESASHFLLSLTFATVGAMITSRRPRNTVGWIFTGVGLYGGLIGLLEIYGQASLPGNQVAAWMAALSWAPLIGLVPAPLLLLFPDGRLPSGRWHWVLWAAAGFVVFAVVGNGFSAFPLESGAANPFAIEGAQPLWTASQGVASLLLAASLSASLVALVRRYRHGSHQERAQLKWFLSAAALLPVAVVLADSAQETWGVFALTAALALLPVAAGVAVLRYRLYEIDRIISRTISYGVVTALLVAAYLGGVAALGQMLSPVSGDSQLAVAGSTLAVAALFGPLRRRVQAIVDRRFNRSRYDAARTIDDFNASLRDAVDLEQLSARLVGVVGRTVQPAHAWLWLRAAERAR